MPPFNALYASNPGPSSSSASHPSRLSRPYPRNRLSISNLIAQSPTTQPSLQTRLIPVMILTTRRIIQLTRIPTPSPTTPPPDIPLEHLQNATNPRGMTQFIVLRTVVQNSSRNALTLQPSSVDVFFDLKADFLDEVDYVLFRSFSVLGLTSCRVSATSSSQNSFDWKMQDSVKSV